MTADQRDDLKLFASFYALVAASLLVLGGIFAIWSTETREQDVRVKLACIEGGFQPLHDDRGGVSCRIPLEHKSNTKVSNDIRTSPAE